MEITLNFREYPIFELIKDGVKTVETRALNPDEPERYFGNIKVGDKVNLLSKNTGEMLVKEIIDVRLYQNYEDFLDAEDFTKIYGKKLTKDEVRKTQYGHAGYQERLTKYGIIALEIK
jgi:ASC-1-like (ASCH) protein